MAAGDTGIGETGRETRQDGDEAGRQRSGSHQLMVVESAIGGGA